MTSILVRREVLKLFGSALLAIPPAWGLAQPAGRAAYKERRVALVIENSKYGTYAPLKGAAEEAVLLESSLKSLEFNPVLRASNLSQEEMMKQLYSFKALARSADIAVLYYTGHGLEVSGINYLLPVSFEGDSVDAIQYLAVNGNFAIGTVVDAKKLGLVLFDACRNDPFRVQLKIPGDVKQYDRGLAPIPQSEKTNVLIQYSTAAGSLSKDEEGGGPYAKAISRNIAKPGISVADVLLNVAEEVAKVTQNQQRPYIGGSPLASLNEIFLVPQLNAPPVLTSSPVVVDVQLAENDDEAVRKVLKDGNNQFNYVWEDKAGVKVYPKLTYFERDQLNNRPYLEGQDEGYYSPEEGSGLGIAYPILDIVVRRSIERVVTLASVTIDVERSTPDNAPYVTVTAPSDQFARIVITNEGWSNISNVELEYNLYGPSERDSVNPQNVLKEKKDASYAFRSSTGQFRESSTVSLESSLSTVLGGDFQFYKFAFSNSPYGVDRKGNPLKPNLKGAPKGYKEWLGHHPVVFQPDDHGSGALLVGRMTVTPSDPQSQPIVADLVSNVPMYAPEGLGGGYAEYNTASRIILRSSGSSYSVTKPIGYILDNDTKTFRALYPLMCDRSSDHRLRVILKGDGGQKLYVSEWIDAKILVPRTSKKYTKPR